MAGVVTRQFGVDGFIEVEMPSPSACPLCSAPPFGCDHDGLRWSYVAGEYEESPLAHDAILLGEAVDALLKDCWMRRRPPSDPLLVPIYLEGLALIDEDFTADDALYEISLTGTGYALEFFEQLPGVIVEDELDSGAGENHPESARVFWMKDLDAVRDAVSDRIRGLEIERERE